MAIAAIPFTTLYLVPHAAGGAIVNAGGSYLAGTYVPAAIVQAFSAASTSIAALGTSVAALASSPLVIGAAVTIAAVGGYCYFFGIPAPIADGLIAAGLVEPAKSGLAVTMAKVAGVLVILGAAGLVSFNIFKSVRRAKNARRARFSLAEGEAASRALFGDDFWTEYGHAAWSGVGDTVEQAWCAAGTATRAIRDAADKAVTVSSDLGSGTMSRLREAFQWMRTATGRT